MRPRICTIALAFILIAPPVLCRGGVLLHDCAPACCECADQCAGEPASDGDRHGCAHESDCAADPCDNLLNRSGKQFSEDDAAAAALASFALIPFSSHVQPDDAAGPRRDAADDPACTDPPCAEFHLPLLI